MYYKHFPLYLGDLVIRTGDQEIWSVSGRLPDNPGVLAWMNSKGKGIGGAEGGWGGGG